MKETRAELRVFICMSTAHLPKPTAEKLNDAQWGDPRTSHLPDRPPTAGGIYGEYGWFMYVQREPDPRLDDEFPGLEEVFEFARKHGVDYVLLDRDGPVMDGLASYDW
jgi:hypothetical protein